MQQLKTTENLLLRNGEEIWNKKFCFCKIKLTPQSYKGCNSKSRNTSDLAAGDYLSTLSLHQSRNQISFLDVDERQEETNVKAETSKKRRSSISMVQSTFYSTIDNDYKLYK